MLASLGTNKHPLDSDLDAAREDIHSHKQLFKDFLASHGMIVDVSALLPFTQWITPPNVAR